MDLVIQASHKVFNAYVNACRQLVKIATNCGRQEVLNKNLPVAFAISLVALQTIYGFSADFLEKIDPLLLLAQITAEMGFLDAASVYWTESNVWIDFEKGRLYDKHYLLLSDNTMRYGLKDTFNQ